MRPALCLTILCLRVASAAPIFDSRFHGHNWKMRHGRTHSPSEEEQRRAVWERNVEMIQLHNGKHLGGKDGFTVEINSSGDMSTEELNVLKNGFQNQEHRDEISQEPQQKGIPGSGGRKEKGHRPPVKDQEGPCACDHWCSVVNYAGYVLIPGNEDSLNRAAAKEGLHSASTGGLWGSFRFCKGGNYHDPNCSKTLTHTVMTSYGSDQTESDKMHWPVRNRWELANISTSEHQHELPACS